MSRPSRRGRSLLRQREEQAQSRCSLIYRCPFYGCQAHPPLFRSPHPRRNQYAPSSSEQTALHFVPRQSRGTFIPLRLFFLSKPDPLRWAPVLGCCARLASLPCAASAGPASLGSGFGVLRKVRFAPLRRLRRTRFAGLRFWAAAQGTLRSLAPPPPDPLRWAPVLGVAQARFAPLAPPRRGENNLRGGGGDIKVE